MQRITEHQLRCAAGWDDAFTSHLVNDGLEMEVQSVADFIGILADETIQLVPQEIYHVR